MRRSHEFKKLTEAKKQKAMELAKKGKSMKVIFKTIGISYEAFQSQLKKTSREDVKEWFESLYATALEFWEDYGLNNMENKNFRSTVYIMVLKCRFRKEYAESQKYMKAPTPIEINIQNNIPKAISSEDELRKVEAESLKELLTNTPLDDELDGEEK